MFWNQKKDGSEIIATDKNWVADDIKGYVDAELGVQSSEVYSSQEVFDKEMENIFGKCWLLVGHESQVANVGDYVTTKMGNDSVIVTRHTDGTVKVMLNQCRHRGIKLARSDYGNTRSFTCSYHGWCFNTEGELLTMPHEKHHGENFKKKEWGLIMVPRVESYKGLIYACWDENVESLEDYLAEAKWYLDGFFDRHDDGTEFIGMHKWTLRGNWKWGAEQHVSDFYHAQVSHVSLKDVYDPGASINHLITAGDPEFGLQYSSPSRGHGAGWMTFPNDLGILGGLEVMEPNVIEYIASDLYPNVTKRLGETRGEKMGIVHMNVFPNMSINRGQGYLRLWQPISPTETEVWSFVFVDKNMPEDVKEGYLRAKAQVFSCAGVLEQDDTENTVVAQMGVSGAKASKTKLNIMMGDKITPPEDFEGPGDISNEYSEVALRGFYRRWHELVNADEQ